MSIKKTTKEIVGSSIILGIGGSVLEGMGQGSIMPNTIGKAGGMMGAVVPVAYGMSIMQMADKYSKTGRPYKMKKGKLRGIGGKQKW